MKLTDAQLADLLTGIREELADPKWTKQDYLEGPFVGIDLDIIVRDLDAIIEMLIFNRTKEP